MKTWPEAGTLHIRATAWSYDGAPRVRIQVPFEHTELPYGFDARASHLAHGEITVAPDVAFVHVQCLDDSGTYATKEIVP